MNNNVFINNYENNIFFKLVDYVVIILIIL